MFPERISIMSMKNNHQPSVDIYDTFDLSLFSQVSPMEFYRSIFPEGALAKDGIQEQGKYNAIIYADEEKPLYVHDDLSVINMCSDFEGDGFKYTFGNPIMNCIAYAGNCNRDDLTRELYAFVFKIKLNPDLHRWDIIERIYNRHRITRHSEPKICPTYIVTDESEVYFYYALSEPILMFNHSLREIQGLYNMISREIHHSFDRVDEYKKPKPKSIFERYPVVGSASHSNCWTAYRSGDKYSIDELNQIVPKSSRLNFTPSKYSIEYCKANFPDWYNRRFVQHRKPSRNQFWRNREALYEWFLNLAKENINTVELGVLEALASYALKSSVGSRKFLSDLHELCDLLKPRFPTKEIAEHEGNAITLSDKPPSMLKRWSIKYIEKITGLSIPRNKRNGRTRKEHLKIVHEKLSKEKEVQVWRSNHPQGTKTECAEELGICRTTVYKHWEPKRPKPKTSSNKNICEACGAEMEKHKVEPWFWEQKGNYYTRTNRVCPCCGLYIQGRARIVH